MEQDAVLSGTLLATTPNVNPELKINVKESYTKDPYPAAGTSPGGGGPFGAALVTQAW